jgi:transcriptional regulator with XRE-family HTH domain
VATGIGSDTISPMDAAALLRSVRLRARLSLRQLARRAGTSHATLSAYEHGRVVPTVDTVDRIVRAAGFSLAAELTPAVSPAGAGERGDELLAVLELAALFPARHAPALAFPRFGPAR